jgi:type II secretory pathway pseudopilin PulG
MVKPASRTAFSLVEVVLALGVVGFALVAILGVFPAGMRANRLSVTDTRAAQLTSAIVATIDSQANRFSKVNCYGVTLDLASLGSSATPRRLFVSYPSPDQPQISNIENIHTIYYVELRFNNDPEIAPGQTLGPGKLNMIQISIRPRATTDGSAQFFHLVRNRS